MGSEMCIRDRSAHDKVLLSLVCQHLVDDYKVELDQDRFKAYIKQMAGSYMEEDAFMQWFYSDEKRVEQVRSTVLQMQLVDVLADKMKATEETMDFTKLRSNLS